MHSEGCYQYSFSIYLTTSMKIGFTILSSRQLIGWSFLPTFYIYESIYKLLFRRNGLYKVVCIKSAS